MAEDFAGRGRKRPLVDIPLELISLDTENPRLAGRVKNVSEETLLNILYREFDLEEIAYSMKENGYFDEEPIVVVPDNLDQYSELEALYSSDSFDVEEIEKKYKELIDEGAIRFTVIEGNRRVATAKLMCIKEARLRLNIDTSFPEPNDEARLNDISMIPSIVYKNRKGMSAYLGVRHISGVLKWDSYAKAKFIAETIKNNIGVSFTEKIDAVKSVIGDRRDMIRKQYAYYKIVEEIEEDLDIDTKNVKKNFSLVEVTFRTPSIRDYVGIKNLKEIDFNLRVIPEDKLDKLKEIVLLVFGSPKDGIHRKVTDSRVIPNKFAAIVQSKEALEHFKSTGNIDEAYNLTSGERDYLVKKISDSLTNIKNAIGVAYKYTDDTEVIETIQSLKEIVSALSKMVENR